MTTIGIIDKYLPPTTLESSKRKQKIKKRKSPPDEDDLGRATLKARRGRERYLVQVLISKILHGRLTIHDSTWHFDRTDGWSNALR